MIAAVGESLIDIVNGKELIGGCPFNVALAASRLGAPVSYFGKVSADRQGLMILEKMIDNGILFDPELCNAPEPKNTRLMSPSLENDLESSDSVIVQAAVS